MRIADAQMAAGGDIGVDLVAGPPSGDLGLLDLAANPSSPESELTDHRRSPAPPHHGLLVQALTRGSAHAGNEDRVAVSQEPVALEEGQGAGVLGLGLQVTAR